MTAEETGAPKLSADDARRVDALLALGEKLGPGEALAVPELHIWLARSWNGGKGGPLRYAAGWMSLTWPRGDVAELVNEHAAVFLHRPVAGHFTRTRRAELDRFLERPYAMRVAHVGRSNPGIILGSSRNLRDAS